MTIGFGETESRTWRLRDIPDYNGLWFNEARQVLRSNSINSFVFADALRQANIMERQKGNNILLVGPTNCGKSFL